MNAIGLLRGAAQRLPRKPAIICLERSATYSEFNRATQGIARSFLQQGLRPGDRVAVQGANTIETIELLVACLQGGLVAVPINVRLKAPEIAYLLAHSQPKLCFTQPDLAAAMEAAAAGMTDSPPVLTAPPEPVDGEDLPLPSADIPAVIMYTSGTTARPKGVTHSLATLAASARTVWPTGINDDAVMAVAVPVMHASGLTITALPALMAGATLVFIPEFDPGLVLDAVAQHRCTWGCGLPAMMQFVTAEQERCPRDVSSLRIWMAGGDSVPVSLQERFSRNFGIPLLEAYGLTESVLLTWNRPDDVRNGSVGQASVDVQFRVLDLDGQPLPDGQCGELAVSSPTNFLGYWNDPEATTAAMAGSWFHTGDLVHRDQDGFIWFEGRRKELIVRCGSNISPREVEEAIYRHPAILEVGVIGVPDEVFGERVLACVTLREGQSMTQEELIAFARTQLADYKVPERVEFLGEMPKGPTGKVQRRALKERGLSVSAG
jgi:long-chain acyl-CoA synthetase